ncbi:MAG: ABC transporter permease [Pirellulaceae bacterium]|nr:ABC transporter permease [Pirellulaceae bacterium]
MMDRQLLNGSWLPPGSLLPGQGSLLLAQDSSQQSGWLERLPEAMQGVAASIWLPLVGALLLMLLLAWVCRIPISYNVRNLTVRWVTTLMTAVAFTAVIGLQTVMLAFVNGMYRLTDSSGKPDNVMILSEGATDEAVSNLGFSDIGDIENQAGVLRENGRPLCSRETYLVVNQMIEQQQDRRTKRRFLQLRGVDDPVVSALVHRLELYDGGSWFSPAGVRELPGSNQAAVEAVLGEGVASELGRGRSPEQLAAARNRQRLDVGDLFELGDRRWVVVGVVQSSGSTFDSEIWAKRSVVGPMFGKEAFTSLVLRTPDAGTAQQVEDYFNNQYEKAAVQAMVETEYFANLASTNQQFLYAVLFVAVVMAFGGVCGVMNTMFAAISQRIKDIGVLRILGYRRLQILVSFLLESLVIALLGGLLGCALGWLADGWTATSVVSSGRGGGGKFVVLEMDVTADTIAVGLLLALGMGLIGGLLPALSAMRLRPLDALR